MRDSQPEICWGDPLYRSFSVMKSHNSGAEASLHGVGRQALFHAFCSALAAR